MNEQDDAVVDAFLGAYPDYVAERIASIHGSMDDAVRAAIEDGAAWLSATLKDLLDLSFSEQARGPLEVFQEAMRFPTAALVEQGIAQPERDEAAVAALPGDLFGFAPAASHEIGEVAWHAHLAWGAAKAATLTGPRRVGVLSRNLMDRSKLDAALTAGGFEPVAVRGELPDRLAILMIDLDHVDAYTTIEQAAGAVPEIIAYGPHAETEKMAKALECGASRAGPRSLVLRDPARFVATL